MLRDVVAAVDVKRVMEGTNPWKRLPNICAVPKSWNMRIREIRRLRIGLLVYEPRRDASLYDLQPQYDDDHQPTGYNVNCIDIVLWISLFGYGAFRLLRRHPLRIGALRRWIRLLPKICGVSREIRRLRIGLSSDHEGKHTCTTPSHSTTPSQNDFHIVFNVKKFASRINFLCKQSSHLPLSMVAS
jgi:hypothetical protein